MNSRIRNELGRKGCQATNPAPPDKEDKTKQREKKRKSKDPGDANRIKQTGDNGKNEARDDGKKKGQGIMVKCDTRINCKKYWRQLLKIDKGKR